MTCNVSNGALLIASKLRVVKIVCLICYNSDHDRSVELKINHSV